MSSFLYKKLDKKGETMTNVILSTTLLLEPGKWEMREVSLAFATKFAADATNYVGHSSVKVLGIEPTPERLECLSYDQALIVKLKGRPQFGVELSVQEIEQIGYSLYIISRR